MKVTPGYVNRAMATLATVKDLDLRDWIVTDDIEVGRSKFYTYENIYTGEVKLLPMKGDDNGPN